MNRWAYTSLRAKSRTLRSKGSGPAAARLLGVHPPAAQQAPGGTGGDRRPLKNLLDIRDGRLDASLLKGKGGSAGSARFCSVRAVGAGAAAFRVARLDYQF